MQMAKHPVLEKIHDPKFYTHMYYNGELGIYVGFSKKQLEMAQKDDLDLFNIINELGISPPVFVLEATIPAKKLNIPFGHMIIPPRKALDFGCTLQPINKGKEPLIITYKQLYNKICCGQMFNQDGKIMTSPEFNDTFISLIENKAFTHIKLPSADVSSSYKFAMLK